MFKESTQQVVVYNARVNFSQESKQSEWSLEPVRALGQDRDNSGLTLQTVQSGERKR